MIFGQDFFLILTLGEQLAILERQLDHAWLKFEMQHFKNRLNIFFVYILTPYSRSFLETYFWICIYTIYYICTYVYKANLPCKVRFVRVRNSYQFHGENAVAPDQVLLDQLRSSEAHFGLLPFLFIVKNF